MVVLWALPLVMEVNHMTIFKKVSAFIENKPQSITLDIKQLEKLVFLAYKELDRKQLKMAS